jgi:Na+/proline symporter
MGFGVSLILIAVGLVLALAVNTTSSAVDIHTVGWIVAIIGFVGLVLSMIFWNSWAGPGYWYNRRRTTYVDEGPPAGY